MKKLCALLLMVSFFTLEAVTVNYRNAGDVPTTLDFRDESVTLAPVTMYNGMAVGSINVHNSNTDLYIDSVHYLVVIDSSDVSLQQEVSPGVTKVVTSLPITPTTFMLFVVVQTDGSVTLSTSPF